MAGVNKVILIGNLGRDPELRYTPGGTAVATLNLATTRSYTKQGSNERVEETEWHKVTVWGKQAEFCNQYLSKGRQCYVEGRLQTRSYEDKDGKKCYATEVVAETVQFLGGKGGGASADPEMDQSNWGGQPSAHRPSSGGDRGGGGGRSGGRRAADGGGDQGGFDNYIPDAAEDDIPF
jgi:single-strand DNA-binding protein